MSIVLKIEKIDDDALDEKTGFVVRCEDSVDLKAVRESAFKVIDAFIEHMKTIQEE